MRLIRVAAAVALGLAPIAALASDAYPNKPIRLIVSFPPGGSSDTVVRSIQPILEQRLGVPVIVENRGGAGGVIGVDAVAKAAPDGYVIGLGAAGALAVNVSLNEKMPYDPVKDLAPVSLLAATPFILIAPAGSQAKSVGDVIALAKATPGAVSIGHGGNGTAMHLTAQLFNQMAGINTTLVPYRGSGPVAGDVLAGHVPFGVTDITAAISLINTGQLKALGVSTAARAGLLPDVPTFAEAGIADYESIGWFGIVAPAGTPGPIVAKLNAAIVAALNDPGVRTRFNAVGAEPRPSTPQEFAAFIAGEIAKWKGVITQAGAKAN